MASKKLPSKAPGDVVDYPIDFALLFATGEVITDASSVVDSGLTEEGTPGSPAYSGSVVTPVFSGGTEGETYRIVITVTTDQGSPNREFERSFYLTVEPLS